MGQRTSVQAPSILNHLGAFVYIAKPDMMFPRIAQPTQYQEKRMTNQDDSIRLKAVNHLTYNVTDKVRAT